MPPVGLFIDLQGFFAYMFVVRSRSDVEPQDHESGDPAKAITSPAGFFLSLVPLNSRPQI